MIQGLHEEVKKVMDSIKERNSGEQLPPLTELLDQAYNTAIDHAIGVTQSYKDAGYNYHCLGAIIEKLTKLKKPSQPTETQK